MRTAPHHVPVSTMLAIAKMSAQQQAPSDMQPRKHTGYTACSSALVTAMSMSWCSTPSLGCASILFRSSVINSSVSLRPHSRLEALHAMKASSNSLQQCSTGLQQQLHAMQLPSCDE